MEMPTFPHFFVAVLAILSFASSYRYLPPSPPRSHPYEVVLEWSELDFEFPSVFNRLFNIITRRYIPGNNLPSGIKVSGSRVFLTVPRWRDGVPATMTYVQLPATSRSPPLIPYPSWEMQEIGNCTAFQYIQSMEIDQFNRMWVVDIGRLNILPGETPVNSCPPKLVIIDLKSDKIIHTYQFPAEVVSPTTNGLNDIAVGCKSKFNCVAYISDPLDARIVMYSTKEDTSWFVQHNTTMMPIPEATVISILNRNYTANFGVDGIALSPYDWGFDRVYYRPLAGFNLYSVSTSLLRRAPNGFHLRDFDIVNHGITGSQSDGLGMDCKGHLYYGLLANNSVVYVDTIDESSNGLGVVGNYLVNEHLLIQNDTELEWVDTFAFDNAGYLYLTANRINRYIDQSLDLTQVNFRVVRVFIGSKSYMYSNGDLNREPGLCNPPCGNTNNYQLPLPVLPHSGNLYGDGVGWQGLW